MIRIKKEETHRITKLHYEGIKDWINDSLQFYINVFEIIENRILTADYKSNLTSFTQTSTLKANIEVLLKNKMESGKNTEYVLNNISESIFKDSYINNANQYIEILKQIREISKIIIMARPHRLKNLYITLINKYSCFVDNTVSADNTFGKVFISELNKILEQVFNYSKFTNKTGFKYGRSLYWDAYNLTEKLGVRVCPYCNRIYINCVIEKSETSCKTKKITRPSLDHFITQSDYPIFGMSFYNLIPSCGTCNSSIKNIKKFTIDTHIHPFINEFGDDVSFIYSLVPQKDFIINKDLIAIDLKVNENSLLYDRINNSITDLELREIYKDHSEDVVELVEKRMYKCNDVRIAELIKLSYGILSREEIFNVYLGKEMSKDRIMQTSLGKLKNDIIKQLKISNINGIGNVS